MDPSNPLIILMAAAYYILVGLAAFFFVFGVYILLRYGKSRGISLSVAVLFSLVFLQLLNQSYNTLQNL